MEAGQQVGDEDHRGAAQVALDLGGVAVRADAVGPQVLGHVAVVGDVAAAAARAADAALAVADHGGAGVEQPGLHQRPRRQQHRGRIAARVRHDARALHRVPRELRQPVHRLVQQPGSRVVVPVGPLPQALVREPQVRRQVHDLGALLQRLGRQRRADPVRGREQHRVHALAAVPRLDGGAPSATTSPTPAPRALHARASSSDGCSASSAHSSCPAYPLAPTSPTLNRALTTPPPRGIA